MDTKTALGAAGGISLTVVGAVSALVLTLGGGTSILDGSNDQPSAPVVEYVDQYGNPVALQQPAAVPEIVITEAPAPDPNVGVMAAAEQEPATYADGEEVSEEEDYEEHDEYEEAEGGEVEYVEYEDAHEEEDDD